MKDTSSSLPVVIITGGSLGIGEATVREFLLRNWNVAILDIFPPQKNHPMHDSPPKRALFLKTDITKQDQVATSVKDVYSQWGRIDVVINNAGIAQSILFEKSTQKDWKKIFDVNVMGLLHVTKESLPYLKKRPSSHIINIASGAALHGIEKLSLYGMSKAAIVNFSQALHQELTPYAISVCAITPGSTSTSLFKKLYPKKEAAHTPLYVARIIADVAENIIHPDQERIVDTFYHRHSK